MAHEKRIVSCAGPLDAHAFDGIPLCLRHGELDQVCPHCRGHGQWNVELDLVSQRSKRECCHQCGGRGWIETGDDPVPSHEIIRDADGHPVWTVRMDISSGRD